MEITKYLDKNEIQTGKITYETLKMSIPAIFANAHLKKKKHFGAVFRTFGYQGHGRHGRLLCLQIWVKGYMTELVLVSLIN